jgi:hypothetical protein
MAKPVLPDDIRIYVMNQLDNREKISTILDNIRKMPNLPSDLTPDRLSRCVSSIKGQHTKGFRPHIKSGNRLGIIYFIQGEKTKNIKIGFSTDLDNRIKQHQASSGEKLKVIGHIEGQQSSEAEIQSKFKELRIHGEWFKPAGSLIEYINSLK